MPKLRDNLDVTLGKSINYVQLRSNKYKRSQQNARLTLVSSTSIVEGGAHDVIVKDPQTVVSNVVIK